ncbi:MAG: hypothetical protein PVJ02_15725, partial [Gemmatimonadota bacterium]
MLLRLLLLVMSLGVPALPVEPPRGGMAPASEGAHGPAAERAAEAADTILRPGLDRPPGSVASGLTAAPD